MKKIEKYFTHLILILFVIIYIIIIALLYKFLPIFTNSSNIILGITTLLVGFIAVALYFKQRSDAKRDAARIILQEIRRAEDIISDYKQSGGYQFAKKIIATNSWNTNIHFFVGDLENDELDKISDLYSTGEYLDGLIQEVSRITLNDEIEIDKKLSEIQVKYQTQKPVTIENSTYPIAQSSETPNIVISRLRPVWKDRLNVISINLNPIYDSTITWKLKKIAKLK